ncbi:MAG: hypothetical protein R3237_00840 [Nitrosopumilaceae archaeon]|nr:hypothetical protein [Nitrosopumilaceae archaeon]
MANKAAQKEEKISVCELMKDNTSKIIAKLESQTPSYFQQYSDLYSAYLHSLDHIYGTCYISEKEFFDNLDIDRGVLSAYQNYSATLTDTILQQIEIFGKIREHTVQTQISSLRVYDNFIHSIIDSYAKYLDQFKKFSSFWHNP